MNFNYWSLTDQSLQICKDEHTHLLIVEKKKPKVYYEKEQICVLIFTPFS